jgi:hypothetical protein
MVPNLSVGSWEMELERLREGAGGGEVMAGERESVRETEMGMGRDREE